MPTDRVQSLSVAGNAVSANVLSGFSDEYLRADAMIALFARSAVIGINVTLKIGERLAIDDQPINALAGTIVDLQTDGVADEPGGAGEKISLTFRNTTGGAVVVQAMLKITFV